MFLCLLFGLLWGCVLSLGRWGCVASVVNRIRAHGLVPERATFWDASGAASAGAMAEAAEFDAHGLEAFEAHCAARERA